MDEELEVWKMFSLHFVYEGLEGRGGCGGGGVGL